MNYTISKEHRDAIVAYLAKSALPYVDIAQIISILMKLPEQSVQESQEKPKKQK